MEEEEEEKWKYAKREEEVGLKRKEEQARWGKIETHHSIWDCEGMM